MTTSRWLRLEYTLLLPFSILGTAQGLASILRLF